MSVYECVRVCVSMCVGGNRQLSGQCILFLHVCGWAVCTSSYISCSQLVMMSLIM